MQYHGFFSIRQIQLISDEMDMIQANEHKLHSFQPAVPIASPHVPYLHRMDTVLSTANASANTVPNDIEPPDCIDITDHTADLFSVDFDAISIRVFSLPLYNQFSSILTWKYRQLPEDQLDTSQNSLFWPPKKTETTTKLPSTRYPQTPMQVSI